MTFHARLFSDFQIAFANLNRFVKPAGGEVKRMPEAVGSFGHVFADGSRRRMTIVASRHSAMRRLQPAVVLLVHYVTVGTSDRVVAHVGIALAIPEREHTDPDREAKPDAENDKFYKVKSHGNQQDYRKRK